MENGEDKTRGNDREHGDRQIKEGAIQPDRNPDGPPPSTVEVVKPGDGSDSDPGGGDGGAEKDED